MLEWHVQHDLLTAKNHTHYGIVYLRAEAIQKHDVSPARQEAMSSSIKSKINDRLKISNRSPNCRFFLVPNSPLARQTQRRNYDVFPSKTWQ